MEDTRAARNEQGLPTTPPVAPADPPAANCPLAPTDLPAVPVDVLVTASRSATIHNPEPSTTIPASVTNAKDSDEIVDSYSVALSDHEGSEEGASDPPAFDNDVDGLAVSSSNSDSGHSADSEMLRDQRVDRFSRASFAHESIAASSDRGGSEDVSSDAWMEIGSSDSSNSSECAHAESYVETLKFPDKGYPCAAYSTPEGCRRKRCGSAHDRCALRSMFGYLERAQSTLDIAMHLITSEKIANFVINLGKQRPELKIRIITNKREANSKDSQVGAIEEADLENIELLRRSPRNLHHKFFIVDKLFLLSGSMNWSKNGILRNDDNLIVHRGGKILDDFNDFF